MLILASSSKARRTLLEKLNIPFEVIVSDVNEKKHPSGNVKEIVEYLAKAKAENVLGKLEHDKNKNLLFRKTFAILGCDSLFEFNGIFFGKPHDAEEATNRWKLISGKSGFIHTGHCLISKKTLDSDHKEEGFSELITKVISTKINFSYLSESDITNYIQTGEPLNCAGGFSLEGLGTPYINSIEGCYSNVIGLSLPWLRVCLSRKNLL